MLSALAVLLARVLFAVFFVAVFFGASNSLVEVGLGICFALSFAFKRAVALEGRGFRPDGFVTVSVVSAGASFFGGVASLD